MDPEQQLKKAFAAAWLRNPKNPYAAALTLTKGDTFLAMSMSKQWIFDDEVEQFKQQLIDEKGEEAFLPTRCELIREVVDRAYDTNCNDEFHKLIRLVADMRGFIEKPGVTINNNHQTNNRIMVVPMGQLNDNGTVNADSWERTAISQQQSLMK